MAKQSELFSPSKIEACGYPWQRTSLDSYPVVVGATLKDSSSTYSTSGILQSDGRYWTVNTSDSVFHRVEGPEDEEKGEPSLSAGDESLYLVLSDVLEETPLPKYSLSSTACEGILRRSEKRNKTLPPLLQMALEQMAKTG